jgi:colanic acid/amylovoran biosynthesis glycosyltransferase
MSISRPKGRISSIFCAARLSPEKALEFLIYAVKLLLNQGQELQLRLAGDGPKEQELTRLTDELELSRRVHFLGFPDEEWMIRELQASIYSFFQALLRAYLFRRWKLWR